MSTMAQPPTALSDLEIVCAALADGRLVDREVAERVHERAEKARQAIVQRGITNVAVSLIREIRDEE